MTLEFQSQNSGTPLHELVIIVCIVASEDRTSPTQLRSDGSLMGICDRLLASNNIQWCMADVRWRLPTDGAARRSEPSLRDEHTVRCFVAGRSGRAIASTSRSRPHKSFIAFTTTLLHGPHCRDAYLASGLSILKFSRTAGSGSAPRYRPAKIT
jgi:hypothetical protein